MVFRLGGTGLWILKGLLFLVLFLGRLLLLLLLLLNGFEERWMGLWRAARCCRERRSCCHWGWDVVVSRRDWRVRQAVWAVVAGRTGERADGDGGMMRW